MDARRAAQAEPLAPAVDGTPEVGPRPVHVAIIMDGNRRWARAHGVPELEEHAAGVDKIRWLVEHAIRAIVAAGIPADEIDEAAVEAHLYTAGLPDPDLVIRTGGEQRLSNFLIWQSAYAEFHSCPALWPDFDAEAFDTALEEFARRGRRFGR